MDPREFLPHREPFLLIDEVVEVKNNEYSKAKKFVGNDEFWVKGHFPDKAIFPGVLLLEAMAQTGGLIFKDGQGEGHNKDSHNLYLIKVDNLKFIKMVLPGETLVIEGNFVESIGDFRKVKTRVFSQNKKVAEAVITYVVQKKE